MSGDEPTSNVWSVLPEEFEIHVEFLSDWHVGSGLARPGDVDRLVLRDVDDLPYLPAKTLTGILRDAAERVAVGLDDSAPNAKTGWYGWVRYLFGDQPSLSNVPGEEREFVDEAPRRAALAIRSARFGDEMRACLRPKDKRPLRDALILTKPGVTIDARSGSAKEHHLRFEEMARCGITLRARARLDTERLKEPASHSVATALLVAAAKLADRLGGKRRRGAGRVCITIPQAPSPREAAEWLSKQQMPPSIPNERDSNESFKTDLGQTLSGSDSPGNSGRGWTVIPMAVTLESPVLVGDRTVGNVVEGLDYVPGTYFLPLVHRVLTELGIDAAAAIQGGDVRVAPATLEVDGGRGLPVPAALHHRKVDGGTTGFYKKGGVANRFRESEQLHVKDYRRGYVSPLLKPGFLPECKLPKLVLRMHNTVKDDIQRPHEDIGGVYTYQALEPGTQLQTELRVRRSRNLPIDDIVARLHGKDHEGVPYTIGRSKKDDYGFVTVRALPPVQPPRHFDQEQEEVSQFTIWLTSDALLLDGRLGPGSTIEVLKRDVALGLNAIPSELTIATYKDPETLAETDNLFLRTTRRESWQTSWRLPRPSLVCVAAGSCAEFKVEDDKTISKGDLQKLQEAGIGERRAEGYGMIVVNHSLLQSGTRELQPSSQPPEDESESPEIPADHPDSTLARQLEFNAWRQLVAEKCMELSLSPEFRSEEFGLKSGGRPTANQSATVRNAIKRLRSEEDAAVVLKWLGHLSKLRGERWQSATLKCEKHENNEPVAGGAIARVIRDHDRVWELLSETPSSSTSEKANDGPTAEAWPTVTPGARAALKKQIRIEAARTLIDAVLRAHQHDLDKRQGGDDNDGS